MEKHSKSIDTALRSAIPGRAGFDTLVVGAGFAGSVLAERLASVLGQRVLVVDRRPHIGGNAYDRYDDAGVLIHRYGPHIFHTNSARDLRLPVAVHRVAALRAPRAGQRRRPAGADADQPRHASTRSTASTSTAFEMRGVLRLASPSRVDAIAHVRGRGRRRKVGPGALREVLPRLHAQAVGPRSVASSTPRHRARPDAHQPRRPLFHRHASRRCRCTATRACSSGCSTHPNIEVHARHRLSRGRATWSPSDHMIYTGPIDEFFDHRYGKLPYRSLRVRARQTLRREQFQPVGTRQLSRTSYALHPDHRVQAPDRPAARADHDRLRVSARRRRSVLPGAAAGERGALQALRGARRATDRRAPSSAGWRTYRYYNMDQVVGQALAAFKRLQKRSAQEIEVDTLRSAA